MSYLSSLLVPRDTHYNFMGKKWWAFSLSISLMLATFALLAVRGLNFGIDFTGGMVIEAWFKEAPQIAGIRQELQQVYEGEISLQHLGDTHTVLIRIGYTGGSEKEQADLIHTIKEQFAQNHPQGIEYRKIDYVGPRVGKELVRGGILSLILTLGGIMVYVWFRFAWQYGIGGVAALIHDTILTLGFYSLTQIEFNLSSVAAILTVIGYSINDSVVIFDRIRDNLRKYKKMPLEELLNESVNVTLSRTIMTSLTVVLAASALVFFGGDVIRSFSAGTLFGVLVGTYSTIYISVPVLIYFRLSRSI